MKVTELISSLSCFRLFRNLRRTVPESGSLPGLCVNCGLLLSAAVFINAVPTIATAGDHITVTQEILLESDVGADPEAIVQTSDYGFVIAGTAGLPWATRVDATGKVVWRYAMPNLAGTFHGAAMLPDDTVILCGQVRINGNDNHYTIEGLLTHLSREGKVISERHWVPNDGKEYSPASLDSCVPFEGGVAVFGGAVKKSWLLTLDKNGQIRSEVTFPYAGSHLVLPLPDRSFIGYHINYIGRMMSRFTQDGSVKATQIIPHWSFPIVSTTRDSAIRLLRNDPGSKSLATLNEKLETIAQTAATVDFITPKSGYSLPDNSLILFGRQGPDFWGAFTASIEWISPDLKQREIYVFEPRYAAVHVDAATPTGTPGEFATVRNITPTSNLVGWNEKRKGVALTFIRVK